MSVRKRDILFKETFFLKKQLPTARVFLFAFYWTQISTAKLQVLEGRNLPLLLLVLLLLINVLYFESRRLEDSKFCKRIVIAQK